ncbi:tRNA (adenosine(37)-N6)-dimethylallyltransferase MiaA [Candidatus Uhrbacteria bacterium]|nr:tRNA (adenosine(37)-N6)-dimethylallyltransferase MiaA [Candidatus Uhrbacteria bacterium]
MHKLIVIVGPTSSGKTKLAVYLAQKFGGEIVSADSRQVYKGMDIGTGKELRVYGRVRYHLIDVVSPKNTFTLAQYQKRAYRVIEDILRRGKLPILVGGTGLYVQAVVDGYILPEAPPNHKLRARLAKFTFTQLHAKLKKLDPATYRVIDKNNRRRLERAIEICLATGVQLSKQRAKNPPPYEMLMLGLEVPRAMLHKRIDKRLKARLKQGMVKEVARLHRQGVSWRRLESLGLEYRYISRYLKKLPRAKSSRVWRDRAKRETFNEMVRELSQAIKDFSRRQMTWFRREKRIVWIKNPKEAKRLLQQFLK